MQHHLTLGGAEQDVRTTPHVHIPQQCMYRLACDKAWWGCSTTRRLIDARSLPTTSSPACLLWPAIRTLVRPTGHITGVKTIEGSLLLNSTCWPNVLEQLLRQIVGADWCSQEGAQCVVELNNTRRRRI